MNEITLTKFDVAQRQLKTAIRLFFAESDCVSIETLVGAATEIFRQLGKKRGVAGVLHDTDFIAKDYKKEWIKFLHVPSNFFKHGGRDPDAIIHFQPDSVKFKLLEACHLIRHLGSVKHFNKEPFPEGLAYEIWFSFAHPKYLIDPSKLQTLAKAIKVADPTKLSHYRQWLNIPEKF